MAYIQHDRSNNKLLFMATFLDISNQFLVRDFAAYKDVFNMFFRTLL